MKNIASLLESVWVEFGFGLFFAILQFLAYMFAEGFINCLDGEMVVCSGHFIVPSWSFV